eukprot:765907-Hanusia_phi.AAC.2
MPVRSLTANNTELNKKEVISLDYDGIRLVYPNTTFGPGFGSGLQAKESQAKESQAKESHRKEEDVFSGIEKGEFTMFMGISKEDRLKLEQLLLREYEAKDLPEFHRDGKDLESNWRAHFNDPMHALCSDEADGSDLGPPEPNPPEPNPPEPDVANHNLHDSDPRDIIVNDKFLQTLLDRFEYTHEKLLQNNEECRNRLKDKVMPTVRSGPIRSVATLVLRTYESLQKNKTNVWKFKSYTNFIQHNKKIIEFVFDALYHYTSKLSWNNNRDDEMLSYVDLINKYRKDLSKDITATALDVFKDMSIIMHCINVMKLLLHRLTRKYALYVFIPDSIICAITSHFKHMFVASLDDTHPSSQVEMKSFYHIMMNLQLVFHFIRYKGKNDYLQDNINYITEAKAKKDELRKLDDQIDRMEMAEDRGKKFKNHDYRIKSLFIKRKRIVNRLNHLYINIKNFQKNRENLKFVRLHFTLGNSFTSQLSFLYNFIHSNRMGVQSSFRQLGKEYIYNNSNSLAFSKEGIMQKITELGDFMIKNCLNLVEDGKYHALMEVKGLFSGNQAGWEELSKRFKVLESIEEFHVEYEQRAVDEFKLKIGDFVDEEFQGLQNRDFFQYITDDKSSPDTWNDIKEQVNTLLPNSNTDTVMDRIRDYWKDAFRMMFIMLRCFRSMKFYTPESYEEDEDPNLISNIKSDTTEMYAVEIRNIKKDVDYFRFFDDLCYYLKYEVRRNTRGASELFQNDEYNIDIPQGLTSDVLFVNVDKLINSMHLVNLRQDPHDAESIIITIAFSRRHFFMQFMYMMYMNNFRKYANQDSRKPIQGYTYFLRNIRPSDGEDEDKDVFYTMKERRTSNNIIIDVKTKESNQVGPDRRIVASKVMTHTLNFEAYKLLENTLKAFRIMVSYYFRLKKMNLKNNTKDNKLSMISQTSIYISDFMCDVIKSSMTLNSMIFNTDFEKQIATTMDWFKKVIFDVLDNVNVTTTQLTSYNLNKDLWDKETEVDECYLGLSYTKPSMWKRYPVNFNDIPKSHASEIVKQGFDEINKRQSALRGLYTGKAHTYKEFDGFEIGNISKFNKNFMYYNHCLTSFN